MGEVSYLMLAITAFIGLVLATVLIMASRYKRCPSNKILVVYGKVGKGLSARCLHGGAAFIWPLVHDYAYLNLTPMTISIPLQQALSFQNIRINVPSTFTVAISTEPGIMDNAAERLLNLGLREMEEMAKEIIFGQLRLTVASLTIEQINQDRESFLESIRKNVEPELNKIGLYLINVNITDITDESAYIEALGKKAAAEAINKAKVDVAEEERFGAVGQAQANREKEIRVAENVAESQKGQKKAEADRRIYVQQQEAQAAVGEADANRQQVVGVAENVAASEKGKKKAEADRRVYVEQQEAEAIGGENEAKARIAAVNADLAVKEAAARQRGEVAKRDAVVEIQKAQYRAEQERLTAEEVVRQEIEKRKVEIAADAEAERKRRVARGEADATLLKYEAEAKGVRLVLDSKAAGYAGLVQSCSGDARAVATLLMTEKIEDVVARQVEAIKNLKIDKITVWDSAGREGAGSSTASFLSSLIKSIPPLHDVASMAGVELPDYLGRMAETEAGPHAPAQRAAEPQQGPAPRRE